MRDPVFALVDTSVWRIAEFVRPVKVQQKLTLQGRESTIPILGMRRVGPYEHWKERQIESLPTIARLAREGAIKLFSYCELESETMKGTLVGGVVTHLLSDVPIFHAKSPIARSRFQQMNADEYANKNTFVRFCKLLLTLNIDQLEKRPAVSAWFPNSDAIKRFREICRNLPEKHYPDAFHLWTAEFNGLDCFLTADKRFTHVMTLTKLTELNISKPVAPRDLLENLGVGELDPLPITDWKIRSLVGRELVLES